MSDVRPKFEGNSRAAFERLTEQFERDATRRLLGMVSGGAFLRRVVVQKEKSGDRLEIDLVRRPDGTWSVP